MPRSQPCVIHVPVRTPAKYSAGDPCPQQDSLGFRPRVRPGGEQRGCSARYNVPDAWAEVPSTVTTR
jgi:hypothetical protein